MIPIIALLQATAPGGGVTVFVGQLVIIFAIFYFLLIRPQQKQRKDHEERLRNLKRGDEVVTAGGIVGEVVQVKEGSKDGASDKGMEDRLIIKSAESRLVVERGRIARVITPDGESKSPT